MFYFAPIHVRLAPEAVCRAEGRGRADVFDYRGARQGGISRSPNPTCQFILFLPVIIQRLPRAQCPSCVKSGGHKEGRGGWGKRGSGALNVSAEEACESGARAPTRGPEGLKVAAPARFIAT